MTNLKAAIALLPDRELSNRISAAALLAHAGSAGRMRWPRLPAHLTLGQPFAIESVSSLERYLDQLARGVTAIDVVLGPVEIQPPSSHAPDAVVWVRVLDCPPLLGLRQRLRSDLGGAIPGASAAPDGEEHPFHLTLGFLPTAGVAAADALPRFDAAVATLDELGLFLYEGLPRAGWQCMLYSRHRLGAIRSNAPTEQPSCSKT